MNPQEIMDYDQETASEVAQRGFIALAQEFEWYLPWGVRLSEATIEQMRAAILTGLMEEGLRSE